MRTAVGSSEMEEKNSEEYNKRRSARQNRGRTEPDDDLDFDDKHRQQQPSLVRLHTYR